MHWTVAAPFIHDPNTDGDWLIPYVPGDRHQFSVVPHGRPLRNWHNQSSSVTGYREWLTYLQHGREAIRTTEGGVITVFPQLASTVGIHQRISHRHIPVVAWLFNVGYCYTGVRQWLAQTSLKHIDRFIVHSRRECDLYSKWLELPQERFKFVPYQSAEIPILYEENEKQPFLVAVGSAHRDFQTLFRAVSQLNVPTVVASGARSLAGLDIPQQVKTPFDIGKQDCIRLVQEARINIVPLSSNERVTAAGQVTIVESMRMGRATIASRCNGAEDYIIHGKTGLLVEPQSVDGLLQAIELLWNDESLRNRLGAAAKQYAAEHFSDEASGKALGKILDSLANKFE